MEREQSAGDELRKRAQRAEEEARRARQGEAEAVARAMRGDSSRSRLKSDVGRLQGQLEEARRALRVAEERAKGAELRLLGAAAARPYSSSSSSSFAAGGGRGAGMLALPGPGFGAQGMGGGSGGRGSALAAGQELLSSSMSRFQRATDAGGGYDGSRGSSRASSPGRVASRGMMADAIGHLGQEAAQLRDEREAREAALGEAREQLAGARAQVQAAEEARAAAEQRLGGVVQRAGRLDAKLAEVYAAAAAAGVSLPPLRESADLDSDGLGGSLGGSGVMSAAGAMVPFDAGSTGAGSGGSVAAAVQRAVEGVRSKVEVQLAEASRNRAQLEEAREQLKAAQGEVQRLRDSNGRLYGALEDADGGLARLQQAAGEAERLAEQRRVEGEELRARVGELEKRLRAYHRSREDLKARLQAAEFGASHARREARASKDALSALKGESLHPEAGAGAGGRSGGGTDEEQAARAVRESDAALEKELASAGTLGAGGPRATAGAGAGSGAGAGRPLPSSTAASASGGHPHGPALFPSREGTPMRGHGTMTSWRAMPSGGMAGASHGGADLVPVPSHPSTPSRDAHQHQHHQNQTRRTVVLDPPAQSWPEQLRRDLHDIAAQERNRESEGQAAHEGHGRGQSPMPGDRPTKMLGASGRAADALGLSPGSRRNGPAGSGDGLHPVWDPPASAGRIGSNGPATVLSVTPSRGRGLARGQDVPFSARSAGGVAFEVPSGQEVSLEGAAEHLEKRVRAWEERSASKGARAAKGQLRSIERALETRRRARHSASRSRSRSRRGPGSATRGAGGLDGVDTVASLATPTGGRSEGGGRGGRRSSRGRASST